MFDEERQGNVSDVKWSGTVFRGDFSGDFSPENVGSKLVVGMYWVEVRIVM